MTFDSVLEKPTYLDSGNLDQWVPTVKKKWFLVSNFGLVTDKKPEYSVNCCPRLAQNDVAK